MAKPKTSVADVPHMLRMWDYEKNEEKPEDVSAHCTDSKWWKCPDCGYPWPATPKARYKGSGKCPCHDTNKAIWPGVNDVLTLVKGLADLLDDDNDFDAIRKEGVGSSLRVNFKCDECGRKWPASLIAQIKKDGQGGYTVIGCPHYNTLKRKEDEVPFCSEVDAIIKFWDDDNPMDPKKTKSNSNDPAHFICSNCGYDWTVEIRSQGKGTGKCKCCELQLVIRKDVNDVFTLIPESKRYYNFKKNKGIDIYTMPLRDSETQIDWQCPDCEREWQSTLAVRVKGKKGSYSFAGCQECYIESLRNKITPVAAVPKLVKHWNYAKNKARGLDVNLTSAYSEETADWCCKECGYEWEGTIKGRMSSDGQCPFCSGAPGAIITGKNDVLTLCPEFSSIYDFDYNEKQGIDIYKLGVGFSTVVHCKCKKCGHEWNSHIYDRVKKNDDGTYRLVDCPKCSNGTFRKLPYSVEYPDLAKMYRDDLNAIPLDSIRGAEAILKIDYHWDCLACGETFDATLNAMIAAYKFPTKGCPYCSHRKARTGESFADVHPEMMAEYDPSNTLNPYEVLPNCKEDAKWICQRCDYHWPATFAVRHMGYGNCPVCNHSYVVPDKNSFAAVYPDYVKYWADSNERKADEVFFDSSEYHLWYCFVCKRDYPSTIDKIVGSENACPYCNGRRAIPGETSLLARYPEIAKLLSPNDGRDPDYILPTTSTDYIWRCPDCNYDYNAPVNDMLNGYTCPYCNDRIAMPGFNSFGDKHSDLVEEMDPVANYLLPKSPFEVLDISNYKFWFICKKDPKHRYSMSPSTRLMFQKRHREPCLYCRGQRRKLNHFVSYNKNK